MIMTYSATAWYVASDEEFSLLDPFPWVATGRHVPPRHYSWWVRAGEQILLPKVWMNTFYGKICQQPALSLLQSLFPIQKTPFKDYLEIIQIFSATGEMFVCNSSPFTLQASHGYNCNSWSNSTAFSRSGEVGNVWLVDSSTILMDILDF